MQFSCNNADYYIHEPNLEFKNRNDLIIGLYDYENNVKTKLDTIQFLKFNKEYYNENCMVFSKKDTSIDFYFNVCDCELIHDTLKIKLRHIKSWEDYNLSATEFLKNIEISICNEKYEILYTAIRFPNLDRKIKVDTLNIQSRKLILSENNFSTGKQLIGELTLKTEQDSVFGSFNCSINSQKKALISDKEINVYEIYQLVNQVYVPYSRDTSKIKNVIEYPFIGNLGYGMNNVINKYLSTVEKLSQKEIDFINNQISEYPNGYSYGFYIDTTWTWTEKLIDCKIISKEDYISVKNVDLFDGGFELFNEKFGNCVVLLSKPLISQNRDIFIINEQFDNSSWCGTGKERTFLFKKVNNHWELRFLLYH